MRYFFDTSALAKLFCPEAGTEVVQRIVLSPKRHIFVSILATVEFASTVGIKVRTQAIDPIAAQALLRQMQVSLALGDFVVQKMLTADFELAKQLLLRYAMQQSLRTLVALQLAAALRHKRRYNLDHFVTSDQRLAAIAAREGLYPLDPANP